MHFKLERTSCQQSLKYISLYNTEGAPFSTEKRNIFLCTEDTYYYTEYYPLAIARPAEAVQSWSGKNRIDAQGASTLEDSGGMLPREILKFSFSKMHILRIHSEI